MTFTSVYQQYTRTTTCIRCSNTCGKQYIAEEAAEAVPLSGSGLKYRPV